ncbi:zinc ribbon domain-containing protein [Primorskyibacter flagellatus]|uniref:zinc ribbon domain-containing protein n=1 Tax=Primorskyibacter flagellatus TaxID=1387277 RepID=UPI003A91FC99
MQENLEGRKSAPAARADYHEDFPLRGFVACGSCGNAMTAAWTTGCRKRYAYYRCETRDCEEPPKYRRNQGYRTIKSAFSLQGVRGFDRSKWRNGAVRED